MNVINLFTDFLLQDYIDYDYNPIIEYANSMCDIDSTRYSSRGGWQSTKYTNTDATPYGKLVDIAIEKIEEKISCNLYLGNYWLNICPTNGYNITHRHPGAQLAGVIYISVPSDSNADIFFEREDYHESYRIDSLVEKTDNPYFSCTYNYTPKQGDCLVFPGYLKHGVEANQSKETRISLSFNLEVNR